LLALDALALLLALVLVLVIRHYYFSRWLCNRRGATVVPA
jgi:hypothetical protein